jgi:hypothetical protein
VLGIPVAVTVKVPEATVVPAGVVALTWPVVDPGITNAVTAAEELLTITAGTLATETALTLEKSIPVNVTSVPTGPLAGEKVTAGALSAAASTLS